MDILHEEIEYLVGHLVGNDVDTLHRENSSNEIFVFIRVYDSSANIVLANPYVLPKNVIFNF
jgi:hypothetical protein